ncbi:MAG TPA: superinfection immunity protein [Terriglobales bacterium]|jgi:hypothetical protein|nr:superinfection immunity protein [Terriglobales bacterium]
MAIAKSNDKKRQRLTAVLWIIATTLFVMSWYHFLVLVPFESASPAVVLWMGIITTIQYFLPYITARIRGRSNLGGILIVNLFFGWTILGWCIAAQWSMSYDRGADRDATQAAIEEHLAALRHARGKR